MRIDDILNEASYDELETISNPEIGKKLRDKGYKYLGGGAEQSAWLEPGSGMILKIFGTTKTSKGGGQLTLPQKIFKAFADYCIKNDGNPFLPHFSGWETFEFGGKTYLQIRMERLFEFKGAAKNWNYILSELADRAEVTKDQESKDNFVDAYLRARPKAKNAAEQLFMHLGDDGFNQLWDTINDLARVGKSIGLSNLDLHDGNFMIGSDGHMVISDPFYSGAYSSSN